MGVASICLATAAHVVFAVGDDEERRMRAVRRAQEWERAAINREWAAITKHKQA